MFRLLIDKYQGICCEINYNEFEKLFLNYQITKDKLHLTKKTVQNQQSAFVFVST